MDHPAHIAPLLEHRTRLLAFIRARVSSHEQAEDILQESLLKALRAAPDIRSDEKLLPWFTTILKNAVTDYYRRSGVTGRRLVPYEPDLHDPAAEDTGESSELCECFRSLLPALKPDYARLIEDLDLVGEAPADAARRLGITPGTLKVRRHRARQALRRRLEETCRTCATHGCLDCTCREGSPASGPRGM